MEFDKAAKYVDTLVQTALKNRKSTAFEKFLALRDQAFLTEFELGSKHDAVHAWEDTLARIKPIHKEVHRAKALVYTHLGDLFRKEETQDDDDINFFLFRPKKRQKTLRDARLAESCYIKSIAADPNDSKGWFGLLALYEIIGKKPKINKTLDDIIKRFPEEKNALFKAGLRCVERNALVKGLNYLERAIELDPVDSLLKESFIVACIKVAKHYAENGHMDKGRSVLEKAQTRASRRSDNFNRGLSYLYARWGLLEILAGDWEAGNERLRQAESLNPNPLKLHYFITLMGRYYKTPPDRLKKPHDTVQNTLDTLPNAKTGCTLTEVIHYLSRFSGRVIPWLSQEQQRINSYLIKAARMPCTREQAEMIVDYALTQGVEGIRVAGRFIDLMLRNNPKDARFLWLNYNIKSMGKGEAPNFSAQLKELNAILELARSQEEQKIEGVIQERIKLIEEQRKIFEEMTRFLGMPVLDQDPDELDEEPFSPALDDFPFDPPETHRPPRARKNTNRAKDKTNTGPQQMNLFDFEI